MRRRTTVCFSGVADAQLRLNVREYAAVHGCSRAPTAAVVAVTVAVGDTRNLPPRGRGVKLCFSKSAAEFRTGDLEPLTVVALKRGCGNVGRTCGSSRAER
jgi:hypothetical protein